MAGENMSRKRKTEVYYIRFPKKKNKIFGAVFDLTDSLRGAVVTVFLIFLFVFRSVGVSGDSMNPNLRNDDWLAVLSSVTHYERGDIVVITQPWERDIPIIKRVIAVAGDTIDINFQSGDVIVNGQVIQEDYIADRTHLYYNAQFPITIPEGKVFVMGDNRNNSLDSRSGKVGLIDERYIFGKAVFRMFPDPTDLRLEDTEEGQQ